MTSSTETRRTREAWLEEAITIMRPRFVEIGFPLPERVHISIGFSYGAAKENATILGTTWKRAASEDAVNHVFISPEDSDTARILETLLHELIHVALDCEDGHRGRFAEAATRLGFTGPMTTTPSTIELAAELMVLAAELGEFPHGKLTPRQTVSVTPTDDTTGPGTTNVKITSGPAPQKNRYHVVHCPADGYRVRLVTKWIDAGLPYCGICGTRMELA